MIQVRGNLDPLYIERLRKAQNMPFAEKFLAGEELFNTACEWASIGIRSDHPHASDAEVLALLKDRLRMAERLEHWN